jgi:ubiquinol-cytochrome c reductase cytochrome c subunit
MTAAPVDRRPRRSLRQKLGTGARLVAALVLAGGVYTAFAPSSHAEDTKQLSVAAQKGQQLYNTSCISCHGRNAVGVRDRGPSLVGVGSAAVEFQVTSGRMPLTRQEAQASRKRPQFDDTQAKQIGAYIQSIGGGPQIPDGDLRKGDIAAGGELYRVNCSSCHGFSAGGGALSSGKYAPSLHPSTDRQIYAAMLTGPQNMPVFGDNELTPQEKMDNISYVQNMKRDQSPGGWDIGAIGPTTEGLAIFLIGITALLFATLWIAGKS